MTIKLFNLIASDLGPGLLGQGIFVSPDSLRRFWGWKQEKLSAVSRKACIDGSDVEFDDISSHFKKSDKLFLSVKSG